MGISLFLGGSKRLPRWFGALTVFGSIQPCRVVKMARIKVPQSARMSAGGGGGGQSLFGQCPNGGGVKRNGSSLKQFWVIFGPNVSLLFFLLFASLDQSTTATILLAALYNFYNPRLRVGDRFFSPDYIIRANQPLVDDLVKSLLKL